MLVNIKCFKDLNEFIQLLMSNNIWNKQNLDHYLVVDTKGNTHLIFPDEESLDDESWFFCRSLREPYNLKCVMYIKAKEVAKIPLSQRSRQLILNEPLVQALQSMSININPDQEFKFNSELYATPLLLAGITFYRTHDEYYKLHQFVTDNHRDCKKLSLLPAYLLINNAFNDLLKIYYSYLHENKLLVRHREIIKSVEDDFKRIELERIKFLEENNIKQETFADNKAVAESRLHNNDNELQALKKSRNLLADFLAKDWLTIKARWDTVFYFLRKIIFYTALIKLFAWQSIATSLVFFAIPTAIFLYASARLVLYRYEQDLIEPLKELDAKIAKLETVKGEGIHCVAKFEYEALIRELTKNFAIHDKQIEQEQRAQQQKVLRPSIVPDSPPGLLNGVKAKCLIM